MEDRRPPPDPAKRNELKSRRAVPSDSAPESVAKMDAYLSENGFENDFASGRQHHEIYLSDVRKAAPEKWKTVVRHPIRPKEPN